MSKSSSSAPWLCAGLVLWLLAFVVAPWIMNVRGAYPGGYLIVYLATLAGSIALTGWLGEAVGGGAQAVLFTSRNTYSLARLQMTLWTLVVLSALIAAAVSRAWAGDMRIALSVDMTPDLLTAMGISYGSAAAAPAVLTLKSRGVSQGELEAAASRQGESLTASGQVIGRPEGAAPSLFDLVMGDEVANAGTIDLAKVQQLVITILLVVFYACQVGAWFIQEPFYGLVSKLPDLEEHLVLLMLVSHGGYLAAKAASKPTPAADDSKAGRPEPPATRSAS